MPCEIFSMHSKKILQLGLFLLTGLLNLNVFAFDWTSNDIQLLHGSGFELGAPNRTAVTLEHSDGWKYGSNFFFADIIQRNDMGAEIYTEVYSYLSFNKITQADFKFGPIKDISLLAGLNISNKPEQDNFKAYLLGLSFDLSNPWFNYLQLDIAAIKNDNVQGRYGIQFTPVWSIPFSLGSFKLKFRGFTDFQTANSSSAGSFQILSQPQLLLDIGDLAGWQKDKLYIGTEYIFWHNKFGIKGIDESVVQAMIIGFF